MAETLFGLVYAAGSLYVAYRFGLPVAGSLWRHAARAYWRRREIRRMMRTFALPRSLFR